MNLPNKLTILRIVLAFTFISFLFSHGLHAKAAALVIFLFASFTDLLDGFLAKMNNQITKFGKLMDPIADKVLVLSAFFAFVGMGIIPAWMAIAIFLREIVITALRIAALRKGRIIPSNDGGRHKTALQLFSIFAILLFLVFNEGDKALFWFWTAETAMAYKNAIFFLVSVTVLVTLISGASYLMKNREGYFDAKES